MEVVGVYDSRIVRLAAAHPISPLASKKSAGSISLSLPFGIKFAASLGRPLAGGTILL